MKRLDLQQEFQDFQRAFLNGNLRDGILMKVPEGIKCEENMLCKLIKAFYELKQEARCWFETFENTIKGND